MSADALSTSSRAFYEQTRFKMAASIFLASMAMMSLAYCSTYGGESNSANYMEKAYDKSDTDDNKRQAQIALTGGFGKNYCLGVRRCVVPINKYISVKINRLRIFHVLRGFCDFPLCCYLYFSCFLWFQCGEENDQ